MSAMAAHTRPFETMLLHELSDTLVLECPSEGKSIAIGDPLGGPTPKLLIDTLKGDSTASINSTPLWPS